MDKVVIEKKVSPWHMISGFLFVLLGSYMLLNPIETLLAIALYIGVLFVFIGIGYFVASFTFKSGWYLGVGVLDVIFGVVLMANLGLTAISFPIVFAAWSIAVGVLQVINASHIKALGFSGVWEAIIGILGIIFGFVILAYPVLGALALSILMGTYVILYGLLGIAEYFINKRL